MIEYRSFRIEARESESRTVCGYGSVFNSQSEDLGFIETIDPRAITEDTIKRSDVFATLNHDMNKILARCKYGSGSLELKCDDKGLYYRFDAPNTNLGDELLEYLNRGEIDSSSFAFTVKRDEWTKGEDGKYYRTILEIDQLFDVSPVFSPAYSEASCQKRNTASDYEKQINTLEQRDMDNKEKLNQLEEEIKKLRAEMEAEEEKPAEEPVEEPTEEMPAEEEVKEEPVEEKPEEVEEKEETPEEEELPEEEERNKSNKNISRNTMEKRFSLVKEIRNAMDKGTQINLAELNKRAYTVADNGEAVVETDIFDIMKPLYDKNVLVAAGAKYMTGLVGDVQVPVMTGVAATWEGEVDETAEGAGSFTQVKLSPKRLSVRVPVSLQLLAQDGVGVENAIREDIINAVNQKLEATILGAGAGDTTKPEGLFNGATKNAIADFGDIADLEATVEAAKIDGNCKYIVSPKAKATLRATIKGTNATGMVFENNAIDGVEALSTGHVAAGDLVYGDFSQLLIGAWGDVTLDVVRDSAYLSKGQVCIIVNAYFDAKPARKAAFAFGTVNA
jgi:HK97 family phage major capsid protein/HK97 family phage prohead protease